MYNLKQGFKNIGRNLRLSLASVATVSACIFLFCLFFSVMANLNLMVKNIETKVGVTVFFNEELNDSEIRAIGDEIAKRSEVQSMKYTSAEEAWEEFKSEYFKGREELAEGFAEDNPLKGSANYTIFLKKAGAQDAFVSYLEGLEGVRQVNYSSKTGSVLAGISRGITIVSAAIILLLFIVSVFIVGNTISVSAEFRKNETAIMRLIGATNSMIRAPFVIEGVVLGLLGAVLPLAAIYYLYRYATEYLNTHFTVISDVLELIPIGNIFPYMALGALAIGVGMGFIASEISLRKYLKV